LIIFKT